MIANLQAQLGEIKKEILDGNLSSVLTRFADLILVCVVAAMVGLMIVPLPTFLLDIFLTINITTAVTISDGVDLRFQSDADRLLPHAAADHHAVSFVAGYFGDATDPAEGRCRRGDPRLRHVRGAAATSWWAR